MTCGFRNHISIIIYQFSLTIISINNEYILLLTLGSYRREAVQMRLIVNVTGVGSITT